MNEKCVLISSQNVSQNCLIIRNIQPVDTANVKRSAVKHWLLLSGCTEILIFNWDFRKIHNSFEKRLSCGETNRERDGYDESNSCISQFWNVIRNVIRIFRFIHWHVQIATVPCRSQELLPFLSFVQVYPYHPLFFHQLAFHPPSTHLAIFFLVYLSILLFPNSYVYSFGESYFHSFSVHAQTNEIYLNLLSLLQWVF